MFEIKTELKKTIGTPCGAKNLCGVVLKYIQYKIVLGKAKCLLIKSQWMFGQLPEDYDFGFI